MSSLPETFHLKVESSQQRASNAGITSWEADKISQPKNAEETAVPQLAKINSLEFSVRSLKQGTAKLVPGVFGSWGKWHYLGLRRP
jgi:hypothetical protein